MINAMETSELSTYSTPPHLPSEQIGLLMTYRCNLNCTYCYIKTKRNKDMPFNMATSIIEKHLSRNDGLLDITFYGGETLLAFKTIRKIIEWTKSKHW